MRVLVTGAAGFSGRHIADTLVRKGHGVIAAARKSLSSPPPGIEPLIADLAGLTALPPEIEAIVHVAATQPFDVTVAQMVHDNVVATKQLVTLAQRGGVKRFLYFSSTSIYGRIAGPVLNEETPIRDPSDYGLTKLLGERLLADAADVLPSVALRFPGIVGPGAHRNWLAVTVDKIVSGEPVTIFNPKGLFNCAVHIQDAADLVDRILRRPDLKGFDAVTLGAEGALTISEVVATLKKAAGRDVPIVESANEKPSFTIASGRAKSIYGYAPMTIEMLLERIVRERLNAGA